MKKLYFLFSRILRFLYILVFVLVCILPAHAQISVTANQTANALAQKLVGNGVVVINPTLTCPTVANGIFHVTSSNLGLDSGVVLTSGRAATSGGLYGVNGPASDFASNANGTAGDANLTTLSGHPTNDACVLQFDFRPSGDTIKFNYVFGSEEYASYTCSNYNDVFGFFISGGTQYPAPVNIALVPGTNIPVAVNSVNDGPTGGNSISNCQSLGPGSPFSAYYVDNTNGTSVTYNGITTVLTAIASVSPCDTYHLKLGVADAVDDILDSGVFLEAGSLSSPSIHISGVGIDGLPYCIRGCSQGHFDFTLSSNTVDSLTIHYIIEGSAVNGYDYSQIVDSITIPAGDSIATLNIIPTIIPPAGTKIVKLLILSPFSCDTGGNIIDSAELAIYDSFYVHILTPDTSICLGSSVHILTAGDSIVTYTWTPATGLDSATALSPTATPTVTTTYTVAAGIPGSGCPNAHDNITITVYQPPVLTVDHYRTTCVGIPVQFNVGAAPNQPYTYLWTPVTYLNDPTIDTPTATPTASGDITYTIAVNTPVANCGSTDTVHLHVLPNDFTVSPADTSICFGLSVQVTGSGSDEFTYNWTPAAGVSNPAIIDPLITPANTTTYTVTASYPGCPDVSHTVAINVQFQAPQATAHDTTCVGTPVQFDVTASGTQYYHYQWTPNLYLNNDTIPNPVSSPTDSGDITYLVNVAPGAAGCTTIDTVMLHILPGDFTITTPDTAICKGASVQVVGTGDTEFHYTWVTTDGVSDPFILTPLLTPDTSEHYTITASHKGCPDIVHTLYVDVQPSPTVYLGGSRSTCQYDKILINAAVTPYGYPDYIYTWSPATHLDSTTTTNAVFDADSAGTYQLLFTVSTPAGCKSADSTLITVYPKAFASVTPNQDTALCPGDSIHFAATGATAYYWYLNGEIYDTANISSTVYPTADGTYSLIATSQYGCRDSFSLNVIVHPAAVIELGDSVILYPGEIYQMSPEGNCVNYTWFPPLGLSATDISNPIASPDVNTKYYVNASTEYGCKATDSIEVYVDPNTLLAMPNAFTPGGGPNNELKIIKRGIATLNYFRIFNRWGVEVYETSDINNGWDGSYKGAPQPYGVYVYEIEATTNTGRKFYKQGNITLIR